MIIKSSLIAIHDKNSKDFKKASDYPTIDDLIKEQNVSNNETSTVHHRRDLDSLG